MFTISYAVATYALLWISREKPPGATLYSALIVLLITAFIAAIAARTVLAAAHGQLLPPRQQAAAPPIAQVSLSVATPETTVRP